ncbi:hypothetical protein EV198_0564 [Roseivirga ehrenbergii]|uniref:Uncharacterized protein n=1 Tax=Roseivirga ehrenbergii (strain DSM 102268 / JCM 13514 / KCTC 12282 / NCIMB 14502 / KMM 6017) TaxID=279360 RepID=A0A150X873_ROSEK|nr:hypothetical protein [Roseivirga ehrenbergii]KYG74925.1 hypothetical protein MB14_06905 [Roseivirga ehrenbergii]TCL13734.1 hypothetical protein EV198_0564 [Roseivirga ehrenbergii]
MKRIVIILVIALSSFNAAFGQDVLDVLGVNLLLFGGDRKAISTTVDILPVAILDVEPEDGALLSGGVVEQEAGMPVLTGLPENLWINFTYRASNFQPARIYVSTNQPVPAGMVLKVEIVQVGANGSFPNNPRAGEVILSQTEQVIVYDFANGYTGDGVGSGYKLKYTLENPNSQSLPVGFQVIYRIG